MRGLFKCGHSRVRIEFFTNIATQESTLPNVHISTAEKNLQTPGRGLERLVSEVIRQATD